MCGPRRLGEPDVTSLHETNRGAGELLGVSLPLMIDWSSFTARTCY